jgi:2'-5' RNA ligase
VASNLVIVAIPQHDDDVWQVSSEKKPHMTLCFLGDALTNPNVAKISAFVENLATKTLDPFNLRVDHRGFLGPDEADVLFFVDVPWQVEMFRMDLINNPEIRTAYEAIPQHQKWTPHLTLGYPDTPANKDDWDPMGTQYVQFDKIGVWFGDFEGPEYQLVEHPRPQWDDAPSLAMANDGERVVAELFHHGVKGQKWGVRKKGKPSSSDVTVARAKQNARAAEANRAFTKSVTARDKETRTQAKKDYQQLNEVFLNHPDRLTALRMTKGEKVVLGLIAVGIPGLGTAAAAGAAGGNVASRKLVERAQKKRKAAKS